MSHQPRETSLVELSVERAVPGGRMLARLDGKIVFVAGTMPGERVRAEITRRRGQVSWAETREVLEASPDRREPSSDPRCGGALYSHIAYARQCELKADVIKDAFRRIAKHPLETDVVVTPSPEAGYRVRARLHVLDGRIGFLLEGSHVLCDAEPTRQLDPRTVEAVDHLRKVLEVRIGACTTIVISENIAGTDRVALCELRPDWDPGLFAGMPDVPGLTGVTVLAPRGVFTCTGHDRIVDTAEALLGTPSTIRWTRQAASFFQGNRFLVGDLLSRVMAAAEGERFVDLYSGIGLFAVALAGRGASGVAVEGEAASGQDLAGNAEQCDGRLTVQLGPVEKAVASVPESRPDVVIVDPPRTGLSTEVLDGLMRWKAPRVVYVSCDVATLARDAGRLLAGGYALASLQALDMFPNTSHIECIAVFEA